MGKEVGRRKKACCSNKVSKVQQDRDNNAARLGLKWGKSGGVTEDQIRVITVVSRYTTMVYRRFSMAHILRKRLSLLFSTGYDLFAAG